MPGNSSLSRRFIFCSDSGCAAPASPAQTRRISGKLKSASCMAILPASQTAARAPPKPTRMGFDGPLRPEAHTTRASSINTHSVLVPPPSKPRTKRICKAYARQAIPCSETLPTVIRLCSSSCISSLVRLDAFSGRHYSRRTPLRTGLERRGRQLMRIHPFDLVIVVAYLVGVTLFGLRFRQQQHDLRDYFLGGRSAPWWALAFSIVATETSTLTIIGTPALSYSTNLTFIQLVFGYLVGRVLIVVLLLPGYFRGEFFTAYALIEKRFGARMRAVAASTFLITRAVAEGVRVSAIALVVSVVLGTSEKLAVVIVIALTILYTFEGGMKAVIWTDVAQLLLYLTGSAVTLGFLFHSIPGGWAEVSRVAVAAGGKLQFLDFSLSPATKYTFWSGVTGGAFLTMASHGTDQTIVQRLLAARNENDSRKALLMSG